MPTVDTRLVVAEGLVTAVSPSPQEWTSTDVVVVGSGVAGLSVAAAIAATDPTVRVLVVSKGGLDAGSTTWAQGGIAAPLAPDDTVVDHVHDTLVAGAGHCDPAAVQALVAGAPRAVADLLGAGARLDRDTHGELALTREGGHGRARIVHAGGDATGAEVQRALTASVLTLGSVSVAAHTRLVDLLTDPGTGAVSGVALWRNGTVVHVGARAVVLATGGYGSVLGTSTNPAGSTGDGVAAALRAGAEVVDLEFVQFHPTVLWAPGASGQRPLLTEALRGEGAVLRTLDGDRLMPGLHPLADLAPRDVVARAIGDHLAATGTDHVLLDATAISRAELEHHFPTFRANCAALGLDPRRDLVPVSPGAHFSCGGVRAGADGTTTVPGLFAVGEVAATGVHGANRLASNSLLEGLVFGARCGRRLAVDLPATRPNAARDGVHRRVPAARADEVVAVTAGAAGLRRTGRDLDRAARALAGMTIVSGCAQGPEGWGATDLHTVATAVVAATALRPHSLGCHWRADDVAVAPAEAGVRWVQQLHPDGTLTAHRHEGPLDPEVVP